MPAVTLLGPQRTAPTVKAVADELGLGAPLAAITAGWEEREDEIDELAAHVDRKVVNLRLFARSEAAFARDPELRAAVQERHDTLRALQRLYRLRLDRAVEALSALRERGEPDALRTPEIEDALATVAALDAHHQARVDAVHAEFEQRWRPAARPAVVEAREAVLADLARCAAVAIAGGHVVVLLNRLRLFGLGPALAERPLVAWSAGAMALTDRVVVFHDCPPQGRGAAEVLESGLGLAPGVVVLPHARRRLLLDDGKRVALLAGRFAPVPCIALDEGSRIDADGDGWRAGPGTRRLLPDGRVVTLDGGLDVEEGGGGPAGAPAGRSGGAPDAGPGRGAPGGGGSTA